MTIQEIKLVSELPNYKSFSDAALFLSYSPSVITKYVSNVEEELGVKLFVRGNKSRSLTLTLEGSIVIEALKRIAETYNTLTEQLSDLKGHGNTMLKIGSQPRYGNIHEQAILASFLLQTQRASIQNIKAAANELLRQLFLGKLDAVFITLHHQLSPKEYIGDDISKLEVEFITSERSMYMGVSDRFFPGKTEATIEEFRGFTFAFPFPKSYTDPQAAKAASTWTELFKQHNFKPKTLYMGGYDNTIFQMATQGPVAVTTTNVSAQYEGIKFVKLKDWNGCTNLYYIHMKNKKSSMLNSLGEAVQRYRAGLADSNKE